MAYNQRIIYRYNNYTTKKIPYIRIPIRIRIVKLFKQLLSIVYEGKETN